MLEVIGNRQAELNAVSDSSKLLSEPVKSRKPDQTLIDIQNKYSARLSLQFKHIPELSCAFLAGVRVYSILAAGSQGEQHGS